MSEPRAFTVNRLVVLGSVLFLLGLVMSLSATQEHEYFLIRNSNTAALISRVTVRLREALWSVIIVFFTVFFFLMAVLGEIFEIIRRAITKRKK